jgi:hypothetical protein
VKLSKNPELSSIYYELWYNGCSENSREVQVAKSMFRLHHYFGRLRLISPHDDFRILVTRSEYHPHGEWSFHVNPLDPPMLIRSLLRKGLAGAKMGITGVAAVPVSFGVGICAAAYTLVISPIAIPYAGFNVLYGCRRQYSWSDYWKATREGFGECMGNLGRLLASPVVFPQKVVGAVMSEETGKRGLLEWNGSDVVLNV